ncbi:PAS domain S-box-containing protein [Pelomonas aquatica]|uniref:histidine kinase n=1 Tax=Pelomonas aquatica TaxID=431058 RepID=A0ABU1Z928_9BURK|nr:PAS domain-containing protein [Pelomonas aquatica]MDR7296241.1 PAS domain S-box-containing protein [Pelomonas aquatica]
MTMRSEPIPASTPTDAAAVVEQLPVGIFRTDATGRFIFVNPAFCRLKAMPAEQILGRTAAEIAERESADAASPWRPEFAAQAAVQHASIMQTGQTIEREEAWPAAGTGGAQRHVLVVQSAVLGPGDRPVGSQGILFDISQRRQADQALAHERELLRNLLDHSPDHIYFKDLDSRFIKSSAGQARQFGMPTPDGLVGKSDFDVFSEEHARPAFEDEQEVIRTGMPMIGKVEKETWIDGRPDTWCLTTKLPLRDRDGNIIGTFGITKDITELKAAEREIAVVHKQLVEASRLAGMAEIATNVLHNVGNVLNSVNIAAGMVGDRLRNSKLKGLERAVGLIDEHAGDLGDYLTQDPRGKLLPTYLRDLAQALRAEQVAMADELATLAKSVDHIKEVIATQQSYAGASCVVEAVNVGELLDDALRMNAGALTRHKVEVVKTLVDLPALMLDRHRMLQILVNLISNAKQALNGLSDREPCIRLHAMLAGEAPARVLRISVSDNGEGIEAQNLTRIFSHGFTTRRNGHGFGLHSCVLAAQEMGGVLHVHSEGADLGATFTLDVPIEAAEGQR